MRWCSFTTTTGGPSRLGAVSDRTDEAGPRVLDVGAWARSRDAETPSDLVDLVEASVATQERVLDMVLSAPESAPGWVRSEEVVYLAPLRAANSVRSLVSWASPPVLAHGNRAALLGPLEAVTWPSYAEDLLATCEVAAIIGRGGRDLAAEDAAAHVFGYVVLVAWTVVGVAGAKSRVATSLGAEVVAPGAFDPTEHHGALLASGASRTTGSTARSWTFADLLVGASAAEELRPTDLLSSGPLTEPLVVSRGAMVTAEVAGLSRLEAVLG